MVVDYFLKIDGIEREYREQKADGTLAGPIKAGYDLKQMKKV